MTPEVLITGPGHGKNGKAKKRDVGRNEIFRDFLNRIRPMRKGLFSWLVFSFFQGFATVLQGFEVNDLFPLPVEKAGFIKHLLSILGIEDVDHPGAFLEWVDHDVCFLSVGFSNSKEPAEKVRSRKRAAFSVSLVILSNSG